ncbi:hypothetical protein BT63DRAFT_4288 [Microthyrium microscopicum]|uniref:Uncharacterized protein n=1 Tax=Microthyrium microscopicum TaxID=703497 RepID=A0A6A6USX1_9PEZI|nr:hypothetical protein BT63DRAFT_4288 [Microthyrium microscopicum]
MNDFVPASRGSRAPSVSSAGTASTTGVGTFIPKYTPKPEPAYISSSAAADHITHIHHNEQYGLLSPAASPTNDAAIFSDNALQMLNSFLDSLLYNFLAKAKGTKLSLLRPAIIEVLKAKLGREALASADEELEGLVAEGDDDEQDGADKMSSVPEWHLESAFKRMRLRVMVFIRLGDFDDDDEDKFLDDEDAADMHGHDQQILSSPAAVYVASVLEYLAEQSLSLASEAACSRARLRARRVFNESGPVDVPEHENIVVEDNDVEKIALNPGLGRLWRTFRKSQRSLLPPGSPTASHSRRSSVTSPIRVARDARRQSGAGMIREERETPVEIIPDCEPTETEIAANIPLPTNERDAEEIEIPGLAPVIYDEDEESFEDELEQGSLHRPRSVSFTIPGAFVSESPMIESPAESAPQPHFKPLLKRQRSNSVPSTSAVPWDWIPVSVRRALARYAKMDDLELASIIQLPEEDEHELIEAATLTPLPEDTHDVESEVYAAVLANDEVAPTAASSEYGSDTASIQDPTETIIAQTGDKPLNDPSVEPSIDPNTNENGPAIYVAEPVADSEKQVESEPMDEHTVEQKSKKGLVAGAVGATTLAAAAVGAAVAGTIGSSNKEEHKEVAQPGSRSSLSVQTREVFDMDEPDTARQSLDVSQHQLGASRESSADTVVRVDKSAEQSIFKKPDSPVKKQVAFADEPKEKESSPLLSAYAQKKSPTIEQRGFAFQAEPSRVAPLQTSTAKDSSKDAPSALPVDSKVASSNHIASQIAATGIAAAAGAAAIAAVSTTSGFAKTNTSPPISTGKPSPPPDTPTPVKAGTESPVSPLEGTMALHQQKLQEPPRSVPARDGPPKPLTTSNGNYPVNPYAMLYDDIEPDAIGVAKTSNVPIHSSSPSISTESRPWTPNRGATTTTVSNSINANTANNSEQAQRTRNIPSPLRVGNQDQLLAHGNSQFPSTSTPTQKSRDAPKTTAQDSDDYDLDKPINPGTFQSWKTPKESPTLPKFYNQNQTAVAGSEASKPVTTNSSAAQSQHSPKGSQGSQKSQKNYQSEEIKQREFDALLDRKETVKYTLTPEEIRDVGPYSSQKPSLERKAPSPVDTTRKTSITGARSPPLFRRASPTPQQQQQQPVQPVQQVQQVQQQAPSPQRPLKISDIRKSINAISPEPVESSKMRKNGLMAREARVPGGETKDFVDFIRSCAPSSPDQTEPPQLSHRLSGNLSQTAPAGPRSQRSRLNLVPREPDVRTNANDDLVDFIRNGPPQAGANGQAARNAASPRSDQNGSSTNNSLNSRPSVTDSYNSTAPLVNTNKPLPSNPKVLSPPQPQITKTRRRNKDPYAIDSDDEDDLTALPTKGRAGGSGSETIQEFLMSTSPPTQSSRISGGSNGVTNGSPLAVSSSSRNEPLNFRSPVSASSRSRRNTNEPLQRQASGNQLNGAQAPASLSGRGSHPALNSSGFSKKKLEARPAGATRGFGGLGYYYSTNDLADYLRSSGPNANRVNGDATNGGPVAPFNNPNLTAGRLSANPSGRNSPALEGGPALKKTDSTRKRFFGRKAVQT